MTEKLYDEKPYETEFEACVINCEEENNLYRIELDRTLFFPKEGGQTPDKGVLNGIPVVDVMIKNDVIYHLTKTPITAGTFVKGKIDFEHRFRNMQMHSGEHIFSGLTYKKYGYNNVGFHLSDNSATIDIDSKLSYEELMELEEAVNRVIFSNLEIKAEYPSEDVLSKLEYRSKKELSGHVRIVSIPDVDICACCAPHVRSTGEIGLFKIISFENYKGGVRINYLCGLRALKEFENKLSTLREISRTVNAKAGEEQEKVIKLLSDNNELKYQNVLLTNEIIERDIKEKCKGEDRGIMVIPRSQENSIKSTMNIMHKYYPGTCMVFCGDEDNGYRFLIESESENLSDLLKRMKENFEVKGGGKPDCIQGSVMGKLESILDLI